MVLSNSQAKIGIIGCGWLGKYIAQHFTGNYTIYSTTRSPQKQSQLLALGHNCIAIQFDEKENLHNNDWENTNSLDAIIITVPFSKRENINTLTQRFKNICAFIKTYDKQVFLMSSIGIYPDNDTNMDEKSVSNDELNPTILHIENLMKSNFKQLNILRLGGLMGGSRVFSNYDVIPTQQVVNHVHYEDICLIIEKMILNKSKSTTYNVVAPLHPTKKEIINYQKNGKISLDNEKFGRIISSNLLQKELDYEFLHPDPRTFF